MTLFGGYLLTASPVRKLCIYLTTFGFSDFLSNVSGTMSLYAIGLHPMFAKPSSLWVGIQFREKLECIFQVISPRPELLFRPKESLPQTPRRKRKESFAHYRSLY